MLEKAIGGAKDETAWRAKKGVTPHAQLAPIARRATLDLAFLGALAHLAAAGLIIVVPIVLPIFIIVIVVVLLVIVHGRGRQAYPR